MFFSFHSGDKKCTDASLKCLKAKKAAKCPSKKAVKKAKKAAKAAKKAMFLEIGSEVIEPTFEVSDADFSADLQAVDGIADLAAKSVGENLVQFAEEKPEQPQAALIEEAEEQTPESDEMSQLEAQKASLVEEMAKMEQQTSSQSEDEMQADQEMNASLPPAITLDDLPVVPDTSFGQKQEDVLDLSSLPAVPEL